MPQNVLTNFYERAILNLPQDVANLKAPIDYNKLCQLAIDYCDGVVQQSQHIDESLLEYARQAGKPVLEYRDPDSFADACNDFYDQVWGEEEEEEAE